MATEVSNSRGVLHVVATPIGNLGDLSARALDTLGAVALVAAEDTRRTGRLLRHHGVTTALMSLHEHNEQARVGAVVARLARGESVALVSDAGTPLVSDPGYRLVRAVREAGYAVTPVPGACAAIAALSAAGLPTDRFVFEGFLPPRRSARRTRLETLATETRTLIFYVAPQRIAAVLEDAAIVLGGDRAAVIARELTKTHETFYDATLGELAALATTDDNLARGEIVLLVHGAPAAEGPAEIPATGLLESLLEELPLKRAVALYCRLTGEPRNAVYQRALASKP